MISSHTSSEKSLVLSGSSRRLCRKALLLAVLGLLGRVALPGQVRAMSASQRTVLWFRNDLRIHDNPLFHHPAAAVAKKALLCAYCADPAILSGRLRQTGLPKVGSVRSEFIRQSVENLRSSLRDLGGDLLVAPEKPEVWLPQLARTELDETGVVVVVAQGVTPEEQRDEAAVESALAALPIPARLDRIWGLSLYHIDDLPYRDIRKDFPMVFAPFGRKVRGNFRAADAAAVAAAQRGEQGVSIRQELDPPSCLPAVPASLQRLSAQDIASVWPRPADLNGAVYAGEGPGVDLSWWQATFVGGESSGLRRLDDFISQDLARYKETRNGLIGRRFSSKLSPWVAVGCVSPRRVAAEVKRWELVHRKGQPTPSSAHYLSEYGWRDFLIFLALKCRASLFKLGGPGNVEMPWVHDERTLQQLFHGKIGMPLVDAAIREMAVSGFMSNRARQFVASYVILELKLDWRVGAELFESLLVDYDVHANWGNWMRAAGVSGQGFGNGGSRWFNLAEERDRFDRKGEYVRLWLPELQKVPTRCIHAPWTMTLEEQDAAHLRIGRDYPVPPETPSKVTLEGSASAKEVAPIWYATTRGSKVGQQQGKADVSSKQRQYDNSPAQASRESPKAGGKGLSSRLSRPKPNVGDSESGGPSEPSGSQAVKRRWVRKG